MAKHTLTRSVIVLVVCPPGIALAYASKSVIIIIIVNGRKG